MRSSAALWKMRFPVSTFVASFSVVTTVVSPSGAKAEETPAAIWLTSNALTERERKFMT